MTALWLAAALLAAPARAVVKECAVSPEVVPYVLRPGLDGWNVHISSRGKNGAMVCVNKTKLLVFPGIILKGGIHAPPEGGLGVESYIPVSFVGISHDCEYGYVAAGMINCGDSSFQLRSKKLFIFRENDLSDAGLAAVNLPGRPFVYAYDAAWAVLGRDPQSDADSTLEVSLSGVPQPKKARERVEKALLGLAKTNPLAAVKKYREGLLQFVEEEAEAALARHKELAKAGMAESEEQLFHNDQFVAYLDFQEHSPGGNPEVAFYRLPSGKPQAELLYCSKNDRLERVEDHEEHLKRPRSK